LFQVEEINQNFYEYLGISKDASTSEVRKAYRRLSLVLHPDKNKADDAELKFRF
jgi:DnaJ family protein C protein 1